MTSRPIAHSRLVMFIATITFVLVGTLAVRELVEPHTIWRVLWGLFSLSAVLVAMGRLGLPLED